MLARKSEPLYQGPLAEPYYIEDIIGDEKVRSLRQLDDPYEQKNWERFDQEEARRFALLFEFYEIEDTNDWESLAKTLARQHVPGFRIIYGSRAGRKEKWIPKLYSCLLGTVEHVKKKSSGKLNDSAACLELSKEKYRDAPWNSPKTRLSKRTLETRLSESRDLKYNPWYKYWLEVYPEGATRLEEWRQRIFNPYIPPSQK